MYLLACRVFLPRDCVENHLPVVVELRQLVSVQNQAIFTIPNHTRIFAFSTCEMDEFLTNTRLIYRFNPCFLASSINSNCGQKAQIQSYKGGFPVSLGSLISIFEQKCKNSGILKSLSVSKNSELANSLSPFLLSPSTYHSGLERYAFFPMLMEYQRLLTAPLVFG